MALNKKKQGFTLVEMLVVMLIVSVVFVGFYTTFMVGSRYIIDSKNRLGAIALANEKMEIVRNLAYANIGIVGGAPNGNIPENEDINANGRAFHVHTYAQYTDDPLDGVFPDDPIPNDYKVVKISVSWNDSRGISQQVDSISRFVPPGLETAAGGAPLAINVKGSDGTPVPQATVHIVNNAVNPALNFTVETDNSGHIMIPAAPESSGKYQFTISKNGYETVATIDPASVPYTPIYRNQDVLLNELNMYDYIEDRLSNLTIQTRDYQDNAVANMHFSIKGGKNLSSDTEVYTTDTTGSTDASGDKEYNNISPGNYTITMDSDPQYKFIDSDPSGEKLALVPGTTSSYTLRVADINKDSLAVTVTTAADAPIKGAQVTLTDQNGTDIFSGKLTSKRGIVFYPDGEIPLLPEKYTLKIEASGYDEQTKSITVGGLTRETIKMDAAS